MTLNEAIRAGCDVAPKQVYYVPTDGEGTACVMGAMWKGLKLPSVLTRRGYNADDLCAAFPQLTEPATCPIGCASYTTVLYKKPEPTQKVGGLGALFGNQPQEAVAKLTRLPITMLSTVLIHLNNDHKWTREAIAEWADPQPALHLPMPTVTDVTATPQRSHAPG